MGELRIFGPPGTGKSTRLATKEIPDAVKQYGSEKVLVTSFTKTAAKEIANKKSVDTGKTIPLDDKNVGTLHSFCYRLFGSPTIAELKKKEWNNYAPSYHMATHAVIADVNEVVVADEIESGDGDDMLNQVNIQRAKMIPRNQWTGNLNTFYNKWIGWKDANGYFDYTDLIEKAISNYPYAPGQPKVMFVDESQDLSKLQMKLIRDWSHHMKWLVLAGDDDQAIFLFSGATADAFLNPPIDDKFKRILDQSYRVPKMVLKRSMSLITQVAHRQIKEYKPRPAQGTVRKLEATFKTPEEVVDEIRKQIKRNRNVMVLASCSYMLNPTKQELMNQGIPFHNPYRYTRGDWNPVQKGNVKTTSRDLVYNFLISGNDEKYWSVPQLVKWLRYIQVGDNGLIYGQGRKGLKIIEKAVKEGQDGLETSRDVLSQLLTPSAVQHALDRDTIWLQEQLAEGKKKTIEFSLKVSYRHGIKALETDPKVILGTIHSVKGGEATTVILFPDLSYRAYGALSKGTTKENRENIDAVKRLFYVGMTRAYDELIIAEPIPKSGGRFFKMVRL